MYDFYYAQAHVIVALQFIIVLTSLLFYRRRSLEIKMIAVANIAQVAGFYSAGALNVHDLDVNAPTNIANIVTALALIVAFYAALGKRHPKTLAAVAVLYICFSLANLLFIQTLTGFNTYTVVLTSSMLMTAGVFYFYKLMEHLPARSLQRMPWFYISAGYLVASAATFFLYLFQPYLQQHFFDDVLLYWVLHDMLTVAQLAIVIVGVSVDIGNLSMPALAWDAKLPR